MSTPPPQPQSSHLLRPFEIPGRGRALVASRPIKPGEVILVDSPLLLYPSSLPSTTCCSHCFKSLNSSPRIPCPSSCSSLFCSPLCLSSHSPLLCRILPSISASDPDLDLVSQSLFLVSAYNLSLSSPSQFSVLLSLHRGAYNEPISPALPSLFPSDLTAALLSIDRLNAFALMEPFQGAGERKVRAYGIYPVASFFNHDCLPNACRFDDVERGTEIAVRAMHEIPEGREVCLSYFPVNWGFKERQERLVDDYGFVCQCDRCLVERKWKEEDEDGEDEEMEEEEDGDFPHAYFFVRFLCDMENCGGTLAPFPPSVVGVVSDVMECNVCGKLRKEDEDVEGGGDMIDTDE